MTAVATTPPAPRTAPRDLGPALRTVAGWLAVVVLWEVVARTVLGGTRLIGAPTAMVVATVENAVLYSRGLWTTVVEAFWGFVWGNLAAVLLAALVAVVPALERLVLRVALVVFCLPLVALAPILRVVFGFSDGPQITLAALAVYYTTLVPLLVGLRAVPSVWTDLVTSYGRGRLAALLVVRARASVPYLVAGLQVAVPAAFLGALVGEFTGAERGMGILTIQALRSLDTDGLWALAAISALVSVLGYWAAGALGRWLTTDQPPVLLAAPASGPRRSPGRRALLTAGEAVLTVAVVLAAWQALITLFDLSSFFAKGPADVWEYLVTGPDAAADRAEILVALGETMRFVVPGFAAGLALGAGLAAVFDLSPAVRRTVTPIAVALRCVPIVAIAPLLAAALGRGAFGTIVIVALMTFFPTLVACSQGLRQAPGQVLDLFASYDVARVRTLGLAQLPAMLPAFFAAARLAVPSAVLGATVAEWLATGTGMGFLLAQAGGNNRYGTLWAATVVLTVVAVAGYALVTAVERVVLARYAPEQVVW